MDPITHLVVTLALVGRDKATLAAGLAPDLPFYAAYPVWWLVRGRRATADSCELPLPPEWLKELHYASHSLLAAALLAILLRRRADRRRVLAAWLLHLALDIPSHARDRMAPRPFWPLSDWGYDGRSWSDAAWRKLRRAFLPKERRPG